MKKIVILLPIIIALVVKIFSLPINLVIDNYQMQHPILYAIKFWLISILYVGILSSLFETEDKDKEEVNSILYVILVPIAFYLIANFLSVKVPGFITNFANSHNIIFSILIGIVTAFYLLMIAAGAVSVIEDKKYSYPRIIFALIPAITIILLYIFNIGMPPFIINFYNNHKIWFFIVFSIIALSYICVLFSLVSFSNASRTAFVFIIAFAVLTFIFRDNVLFFNYISDNKIAVNNNEDIENVIITEENSNIEKSTDIDSNELSYKEDSANDIFALLKDNFYKVIIISAVLVILFIINTINNSRNSINITYTENGNTFKLKGKKDNFVITKNGKHSFLVKDGITVAYKPAFRLFKKFKFYGK